MTVPTKVLIAAASAMMVLAIGLGTWALISTSRTERRVREIAQRVVLLEVPNQEQRRANARRTVRELRPDEARVLLNRLLRNSTPEQRRRLRDIVRANEERTRRERRRRPSSGAGSGSAPSNEAPEPERPSVAPPRRPGSTPTRRPTTTTTERPSATTPTSPSRSTSGTPTQPTVPDRVVPPPPRLPQTTVTTPELPVVGHPEVCSVPLVGVNCPPP
jgi:hypothetical protein